MCDARTNLSIIAQAGQQMAGVSLIGRASHQAQHKACVAGMRQETNRYRVSAWFSCQWKT
jgi:hypothetical protein